MKVMILFPGELLFIYIYIKSNVKINKSIELIS